MRARVYVTLKPGVLDPQGAAVARSLGHLGFGEVSDARVGRFIELTLADDAPPADLAARLDAMCRELLANPVIEDYRVELPPPPAPDAAPAPSSAATEGASPARRTPARPAATRPKRR